MNSSWPKFLASKTQSIGPRLPSRPWMWFCLVLPRVSIACNQKLGCACKDVGFNICNFDLLNSLWVFHIWSTFLRVKILPSGKFSLDKFINSVNLNAVWCSGNVLITGMATYASENPLPSQKYGKLIFLLIFSLN